ncbi:methionine ABC transporter permease [Moritella viscosa]|uniref:ABC-type metal ion transport system,permease component n=1 Tax=Moritella viscosa TaxID=80854 RepID=A0A090IDD0_9GAMM|nr:methionine ABC transporter permease [Moritella viscosa]CED58652.1 D-methionine transport system permease protein MetI [Moritella viscosa]SGY82933.1 Putative ABC-type metal ion transport system,permease component [Moritella viscosa]SGY83281.1 Putative ABC-type metal ion transport system,permease component [Moritella viscosa]SGY83400.1 Putative ABC-type metal ion transport system,permease component [Moritella viscosa]SGY83810.1 Putative ABC-type metal ion transport system,permease component [
MSTEQMINLLFTATVETLVMVGIAAAIACLLGMPTGILLHVTKTSGILENKKLNNALSVIVNIGRSVPFIILLVAIIPFTRLIVGSSIGTGAMIVPLTVASIPFIARLIEGALLDVPAGLVEAAQTMGATPLQIIIKVLIPEAMPGIINSITITLVTLVNYSAMAGTVGGGGLGDVGIQHGYIGFNPTIILITVILLVIIVQIIQSIGERLISKVDHR